MLSANSVADIRGRVYIDPMLTIRSAEEKDVPVVLSLIRALASYEKLSHEVTATEESIRDGLFGGEKVATALLAEWEGEAVGFALFFRNFSTFVGKPGLYLEDLFVKPTYRGRGVGRALLQAVARIAVDKGYARMDWSVLNWNQPAIVVYQRLGARAMVEWGTYRLMGDALHDLANGVRRS